MLKKWSFFALLLLFTCLSLSAQTTPISDTNFEQDLVDQGIDTNGLNGNILDTDAQAITDLNITRNDITDFTGLEAFVNLITLDLGRNDFATAPLTTLTLLEELVFDDNDVLASLDITQNVNLKILTIGATGNGGTPPIPSLDISQNIQLEDIYIYAFTSLSDIILPQTATLKNIQIIASAEEVFDFTNHSGLEELWLNQNTSTTNITLPTSKTTLTKLDIRNQRVSSVDLTGFNALEDVNLGGTEVETLLLPTSTALRRLTITRHKLPSVFSFASVPNLVILYVTSNLLTTAFDVDITSNTLLDDLDLSNNKMENLNMTQNTLLTEVDVSRNALVTFDTSQNTLLEDLNASRNNITSLDLSQNVALEDLNLNTNELPTIDLTTNIELDNLNLGSNQIPTLDITTNTKITNLSIDDNLFTTTGLDLTQNVDLRSLNAERNQIESLDITQNLDLNTIILNYNLFPGTAILDQFYAIRAGDDGIRSGTLEVSHNLLTGSIPNFTDLMHLGPGNDWTRYFELTIDNNYFEFGDIEGEHQDLVAMLTTLGSFNIPVMRTYDYAPQAKVNAIENLTPNAGTNITLITNVRGAENHYQWFKDGVPIPDATDSPEYTITDLNTCDDGVYHSEITSDLVPFENANPPGTNGKNLLLVRNDITLAVNATKACVTLANPVNGASNVPINTGIEWNDNPGACGYKISVGTSSGATDIVNNEDVGEVSIYNFAADLPSNQEIFVTITPYFDDGDFTGCTEESFTTNAAAVAPDCTSLNTPSDGDTEVSTAVPSITWNPANGADTYQISISSTSGNNDMALTDIGNALTHTFATPFQNDDVVTVTIIPRNSVGDAIGPCTSESFTIGSAAPSVSRPFITTWETTTANETITIPTSPFSTYDYTIDWGDGIIDTSVAGDITHTFNTPGIQTISITGAFPQIHFNGTAVDRDKIVTIEQWGDIEWQALTQAFKGCSNLNITNPAIDTPDLSNVTDISEAFADATSFNGDITQWNVSTVTNMVSLFQRASVFNQDIGDWDVSNVELMHRVFEAATVFNQDIGDWNVSSVTYMPIMFAGATNFNQDISNWNVSQVVDMNTMFAYTENFNQDIGNWNVTNVTNMNQMFLGATAFNQDLSFKAGLGIPSGDAWNTSNVTRMIVMFSGATSFDQDISSWNVSNVTHANSMFFGVTLSTANYDALLIGWNSQNLQSGVEFSGGNSQYCGGATARANMIASDSWTISDGGLAGPTVDDLADQTHADSYTLPTITGAQLTGSEAYYTATNGGGTRYDATTIINFADFPSYPVNLFIYDGSGLCSSEESFQLTLTNTGTVPNCTSLTTPGPIDGDTNVATDISNITWNSAADATGYKLAISSTSGNNNMTLTDIGNMFTHTFATPFQNDDVVTVTLIPFNGVGDATGPCASESFTIESAAPQPPLCTSLASPANNDTNVATNISNITWNSATEATGYKLAISSTSGNNNMTLTDIGNMLTHTFTTPFQNDDVVTVTIIPYNGVGDATGPCATESFTIQSIQVSPNCATLILPINEGTNIPIDTNIEWNEVNGAVGYYLTVGTTSGGNDILDYEDVGMLTSYNLPTELPEGTIIYLNITPYNSSGNITGCEEQTFTTMNETEEPTAPEEPIIEDETKYGFSPDGDGINEYWHIDNIEIYPENIITIYNRWGDAVFKIANYDNGSKVFQGDANLKTKMGAGKLPSGTYFFDIQIDGETILKKTKGYVVIKR
ncbi:BspA family leucine-rich repeat surface protein [Aurantibacter crassamenti]|uniref:BspA family leucine-rich repeat surface protein n=1 Tax=Aurantibacter crassamenti TaxID=1837375 RepID=UPI001939B48D|nr:BspA family leucine-rich repeat surface protein [Aurantibacter crassamenti]MBM1104737.1 BspA family leucine-rich repeat surface protein [Aurantibacter crassamenti]